MKLKNLFSLLKNKLSSLTGKNKKFLYFGIILIVLVALIMFVFPSSSKSDSSENQTENLVGVSQEKYEAELEQKLKQMLLSVSEVSSASVMVVCDETERVEYLKNTTETSSGSGDSLTKTITEEVVYEKNGSNSYPIIVSKTMPKVIGVWIVINEVSASTKLAITNSICSVLNIEESRISILQGR